VIVYDTGALIAADRGNRVALTQHDKYLAQGIAPRVPAGVLAQVWRGGPQPELSRVLDGCVIENLDEPRARATGALCAVAGTADIIDASVVMLAELLGAAIVTSDPDDLRRLVTAMGADIPLITP
jgi:hypothetical protein